MTSFAVTNFRSIRERVALDALQPVEVLHGPNNAGKTNLLQALKLGWDLFAHLAAEPDAARDAAEQANQLQLLRLGGGYDADVAVGGAIRRFRWADFGLAGAVPNRETATAPVVLEIRTAAPTLEVRLSLEPVDRLTFRVAEVVRRVDERPWDAWLAELGDTHGPLDAEAVLGHLGLPARILRFVDVSRRSPEGAASWDDWLIAQELADTEGLGAAEAFRRLGRLLGEMFRAELGPGTLARTRQDRPTSRAGDGRGPLELAWERPSGEKLPFSEMGSGIRGLKNILIPLLADPAPLVALEEPEAHQSIETQERLLTAIRELVRGDGRQVLISSHVETFDLHPGIAVRRENGATRLERDPALDLDQDGTQDEADLRVKQAWSHKLKRDYVREDRPSAAFVTRSGLVRLPASVVEVVEPPEVLVFGRLANGAVLMVPSRRLAEADAAREDEDPDDG